MMMELPREEPRGHSRSKSSTIVKMRNPFFATDSGITAAATNAFRHHDRRNRWAKTMAVTNSIRLDRILLHSRATSISSPGIDNMIPSCVAGGRRPSGESGPSNVATAPIPHGDCSQDEGGRNADVVSGNEKGQTSVPMGMVGRLRSRHQ
jgi:hypothetical protein